jgi:hypothetical protein
MEVEMAVCAARASVAAALATGLAGLASEAEAAGAAGGAEADAAALVNVGAIREEFRQRMAGVQGKVDAAERHHKEKLREKIAAAKRERAHAQARAAAP